LKHSFVQFSSTSRHSLSILGKVSNGNFLAETIVATFWLGLRPPQLPFLIDQNQGPNGAWSPIIDDIKTISFLNISIAFWKRSLAKS
jgi:hypothetical protein